MEKKIDELSFPTCHAAMSWMFLPLSVLLKDRKIKDPTKFIVYFLILDGIFVTLSRFAVVAHYASDILFSSDFAAIITILFYR